MLFNFTRLSSWIPTWPNFKVIPPKTAPILPSHVFTNGVSRSLPPPIPEKPHYLPQADQKAKKVLQKMIDNGLVRDLTEEVSETVSINEKGRELFLQYHYPITIISSLKSLGLEEAKEQLMTLAHLMKYEKPDTSPREGEVAKRVFLVDPSLPNSEKTFLCEQIISAYGSGKTVFVDFCENTFLNSLQVGAKFSAVLLDESLKNDFSTRTFTQEELSSISNDYLIAKSPKIDRGLDRHLESFYKELLGSQDGKGISKSEVDIKTFTLDLTESAEKGLISPAYGREEEIQSIFDDLGGQNLSSVLLTGPTGCGKTKIAEGIALRILEGNVPDNMKGRRVLFVVTSRLMAGTILHGMIEGRITALVDHATKHANEILIVFDEVAQAADKKSLESTTIADHFLTSIDRANFPMVAMTTDLKFERLVKSNLDFVRRFQHQKIDRMTPKQSLEVLELDKKRLEGKYSKHGKLSITSEALEAIVYLSFKLAKHEGLPSSAYKLLDTICNRASREGITEATAEVVINRIAKKEKTSTEDITLELERLKNDQHLTLIDPASLLHKYGKRIAPSTKLSIDRAETNVVAEALNADEYTAVFITGQPRVGKTTLIHQVFKQFPSRVALTIDLNEIYYDIQRGKVKLSEVVKEMTDKAEQLILFFQGTQLTTQFGAIFLDSIEEEVECGKLFLIVEMRENVEIPPLWKNRCPIIDVPRLAEITQAKTAHQWKSRPQAKPSSWSALIFRKFSVLTSSLTAFFHRIASYFPW